MALKGPWHVSVADEMRENGISEDGEQQYCVIYFYIATNKAGYRYIGPIAGNNRKEYVEEIRARTDKEIKEKYQDFDPTNHPDWQRWFPCYGSDAYMASGQEEAYIDAERTDRPYYPV